MRLWLLLIASFLALMASNAVRADEAKELPSYDELTHPAHDYYGRVLQDPFSRLKTRLESGEITLDRSSEKGFLVSLLKLLKISPHSQMLAFSTTSLQLSLISPSNPRALYFNDQVYLGYVPNGKIEIVSIDPDLGGIFYLMEIPSDARPFRIERSQRCMNCHAAEETGHVPGVVIKSVIPGPSGGSLTAYRIGKTGHEIPLSERFGGWVVTGQPGFTQHWGNRTGRYVSGQLETYPLAPGSRFTWDRYPVATSDLLPQLLHEHQAGFVNRVIEAAYRFRLARHLHPQELPPESVEELRQQADILARYLLFADEAPLPSGGIVPSPEFHADFQRDRRSSRDGLSLLDFDLRTRLFKHRCSYMIYSPVFQKQPQPLRNAVYARLREHLAPGKQGSRASHLPELEKQAILKILTDTLPDFVSTVGRTR